MIRRGIGVQSYVSAGVSTDADAQAFITAAGITDATQQSAINTLVVDLKTYGVWTKMKAIYPFVGGTSSTHKWNLKDPRDLDAAFRLVFSGGITHSSTGILFGGVNGYADTKMNANSTNFNHASTHVSIYSRTNSDGFYYDVGVQTGLGKRFIEFDIRDGNSFYGAIIHNGTDYLTYTNTDSRQFYILNRTSTSTLSLFKNSTKVATNSQPSTTSIYDNIPVFIGALNRIYAAITGYSNRQYAFASIGDGLTDTEAANFYTAVQAYQTTLSRNV